VSTEGGAGALEATQPRVAPVPPDPWVGPGRASTGEGVAGLYIPAVPASPGPEDKPLVGHMLAAGLCDGKLRSTYPGVEGKWGVRGCANKWGVVRVEIGEAMVIGGQFVGVEKLLMGIVEGAGALGVTQSRVAPVHPDPWVAPGRASTREGVAGLSIPAVPASPSPEDQPLVGDMLATGLSGGGLRSRYSGVEGKWGVGGCANK